MLVLLNTKCIDVWLKLWIDNPTANSRFINTLNYYSLYLVNFIWNLIWKILLFIKAIELKETIKSALLSPSSILSDVSKSKSCYIEIKSSQKFGEAKENTPLLGKNNYSSNTNNNYHYSNDGYDGESSKDKKNLDSQSVANAKLFAIGVLLVVGFTIALYLLQVETPIDLQNGFALDLVSREVWSKLPIFPSVGSLISNMKIANILFLQTGGVECLDAESCMSLLRDMQASENQLRNNEIPYNFLIGSDGQTYEIRGWNYENGFQFLPKDSSLVIGFIGNYTLKSPSMNQLRSASSLINETKRQNKLDDTFQVYGIRNLTISRLEGDALFKKLSMWPEFGTLLKIL